MDKEKKEKIALFRFGVISRLLWVRQNEGDVDEIYDS
jgi:hypothetical protein